MSVRGAVRWTEQLANPLRRKKCDEAHPVCDDCNRLGLLCQRVPPRSAAPHRRTSSTTCTAISPARRPLYRPFSNGLQLTPLSLYDGCTSNEQHLLQHYTHVVSRSLSVVPDEINAFINLFVPMSLQQPAIC